MATIQENLNTLSEIKTDIKTSIVNKGVDAGDDITVYGDKIREISGGGEDIDYLCFEAIEDSAISMNIFSTEPNIEYSFDKLSWTTWNYYEITLVTGDKVYFRGDNEVIGSPTGAIYNGFVMTGKLSASGDVTTLLSKNGKVTNLTERLGAFARLFDGCTSLVKAPYLPSTILSNACYRFMFRNTSITECPSGLEYTLLNSDANNCMASMFYGCTMLAKSCKVLPSTTLANGCYSGMFNGCSSLKESPYLPAKSIDITNCYSQMFLNCSSLQYIKAEFTTAPGTTYTNNWVSGVASTGCFIKAKDATWTTKSTHACPSGWTLITSVS